MNLLHFQQVYLLMIVIGTLVVTGWYFITRGYEETLPDGTIERSGKIFKGWYFFWMREKLYKKKIYYKEVELLKLYYELKANFPSYNIEWFSTCLKITKRDGTNLDEMQLGEIELKWDIGLRLKETSFADYFVFREYPEYVFPEIVRVPLAECATCFSSVYGTPIYWLFVLAVKDNIFAWSKLGFWITAFIFWIFYCFALSVTNTALAKKYG